MSDERVEMQVGVGLDPDADLDELEGRALRLREELLELDVASVRQATADQVPEGTKGVEATIVGTLIGVTVGREAITAVVRAPSADGCQRGGSRTLTIQLGDDVLELSRASKNDQSRLIENSPTKLMPLRRALIVASGAYDDQKLCSDLRAPEVDAQRLADVLQNPEIGNFEVDIAVNEAERSFRRRIARFFGSTNRDDELLLYISGHGIKEYDSHLYLAAADSELDLLDATAL